MLRRLMLGLALGTACSCGATPQPTFEPPVVSSARVFRSGPASRWLAQATVSFLGPRLEQGTWAVLGGRRLLLRADNTTGIESQPLDQPLHHLAQAPPSDATQPPSLWGAGEDTLYRFDHPLGPGEPVWRTSRGKIARLGTAPGLVFVWVLDPFDPTQLGLKPLVFDARTGELSARWTQRVTDVAFLDSQRGAAIFLGSGLAVTADGGHSWRSVTSDSFLRHREDALVASQRDGGPGRRIDIESAALLDELSEGGEGPRERWILRMSHDGEDPLWHAHVRGVRVGERLALAASKGELAYVDLETGLGTPIEGTKHLSLSADCQASEALGSAWFSCSSGSGTTASQQLLRVPLEAPSVRSVNIGKRSWTSLQATSAGGLALSECGDPSNRRGACVLQADGSFAFIAADHALGPARTGALYELRVDGAHGVVSARDAAGPTKTVGEFTLAESFNAVRSFDEEADGTLRLVLSGPGPRLHAVHLVPGQPARVSLLEGFVDASFRFGRAYGVRNEKLVRTDADGQWQAVGAPPLVRDEPPMLFGVDLVTPLAVLAGNQLLAGVGPLADVAPFDRIAPAAPERDLPRPPELPPFRCSTAGAPVTVQTAVPGWTEDAPAIDGVLENRLSAASPRHRLFFAEAVPDHPRAAPVEWRLEWLDTMQQSARARSWKGPASTSARASQLLGVSVLGANVAFALTQPNRRAVVVRIDAKDQLELREISSDDLPTSGFSFGMDAKETLAWIGSSGVHVWPRGEQPRRVGTLILPRSSHQAQPQLASATDESVTVHVAWGDEDLSHAFPLAGSANERSDPAAFPWQHAPGALQAGPPAACGPGATGPVLRWSASISSGLAIDGQRRQLTHADYDLRLAPKGVCAERAVFSNQRMAPYLRVDFRHGRYEQLEQEDEARRSIATPLACELGSTAQKR